MKKVLIVVDMQNDFVDGSLGTKEAINIVPKVVDKIKNWKGPIVYTQDTHFEWYLDTIEGKKLPVKHCIKNTHGWEINKYVKNALKEKDRVYNVEKYTFGYSDLPAIVEYLIDDNIDEIELVGLCTGICVSSNATILKSHFYNEAEITVDASCCACVTPESHKIALEAMKLQQIKIIGEKND